MADYFDKISGVGAVRRARTVEPYAKGNKRPAVSFASILKKESERRQSDCLTLTQPVKKVS